MVPMLIGMTERGPDSAGLAVFARAVADGAAQAQLCSGASGDCDWARVQQAARRGARRATRRWRCTATTPCSTTRQQPTRSKPWLRASAIRRCTLLSAGRRIDLYKDIGTPADDRRALRLRARSPARTLVGHTRMATESAVTPDRAHPFTAGEDFCLVHNGSLSNPYMRAPQARAAGHPLRHRQRHRGGLPLPRVAHARRRRRSSRRCEKGFEELDGFYTFLIGTRDELALVRDRVRLQAGDRRRDRRLRRDRLGVPLAGASARREAARSCSSRSRRSIYVWRVR